MLNLTHEGRFGDEHFNVARGALPKSVAQEAMDAVTRQNNSRTLFYATQEVAKPVVESLYLTAAFINRRILERQALAHAQQQAEQPSRKSRILEIIGDSLAFVKRAKESPEASGFRTHQWAVIRSGIQVDNLLAFYTDPMSSEDFDPQVPVHLQKYEQRYSLPLARDPFSTFSLQFDPTGKNELSKVTHDTNLTRYTSNRWAVVYKALGIDPKAKNIKENDFYTFISNFVDPRQKNTRSEVEFNLVETPGLAVSVEEEHDWGFIPQYTSGHFSFSSGLRAGTLERYWTPEGEEYFNFRRLNQESNLSVEWYLRFLRGYLTTFYEPEPLFTALERDIDSQL